MTPEEKEALFQSILDGDSGWQLAVNAAWECLNADDKKRIKVISQG